MKYLKGYGNPGSQLSTVGGGAQYIYNPSSWKMEVGESRVQASFCSIVSLGAPWSTGDPGSKIVTERLGMIVLGTIKL